MKLKLLSVWWYGWVLAPRAVSVQMVAFGARDVALRGFKWARNH